MNRSLLTLPIFVLFVSLTPPSFAEDKDPANAEPKPEAEFKTPEEGDEEDSPVTARGRSRNIPAGFVLMIFQVIPENDFLFPAAPPFDPNRTFSETIHYREDEQGPRSLELYMLPEADAALLNKWREAYLAHYIAKEKGEDDAPPEPTYDPAWMHQAEGLTAVGFILED
ncbi:MAG: hypothetical protein AAF591_00635 [Verrucomicrobiota bacterium]